MFINNMIHTFNKVPYDILILGPIDGMCDSPKCKRPHLVICTDLKEEKGLETAIHEALHACSFSTGEEKINRTANDIARFLWRLGFRNSE